jgi:hypothetical protein
MRNFDFHKRGDIEWLKSATDELLFRTVKKWIENDWPFKNVYYPIFEELYDQ